MSNLESLTKSERNELKILSIISSVSFILVVPLWFGFNQILAIFSLFIFIISTLYAQHKLGESYTFGHTFELFNIGSEKFHKQLSEQRKKKKQKSPTHIDRVENPDLKQQVSDRMAEGWTIENIDNSSNRVVMSSTKSGNFAGHAVTGFLTGLWTFGAGNIVYNELSKKRNRKRIAVRLEDSSTAQDNSNNDIKGLELLSQLNNLKQEGAITEEEFEDKKKQILEKI